MLEGLDAVDWRRLTHAYGEAADVPELIRALSSKDEEERSDALGELFGNIWHQGTVYEATAFAVPFLIELLADRSVEGKEGILQLLACIVNGHSYIDVHAGAFDQMGMSPATEQMRADREAQLTRELGWVRAAREAVENGVWTYLDLLTDEELEVRIFAAYTLGQCRAKAARVVPELVARVPVESDARSKAALTLALGSLEAVADERGDVYNLVAERLGPMETPVVRLAAAMVLAGSSRVEPSRKFLDTLSVSTGSAWSDFKTLPWCEGDVAVSVGEALAEYPKARLRYLLGLLDSRNDEIRSGGRYAVEQLCHERRSITPLAAIALGKQVLVGGLADRRGSVEVLSRLGSAAGMAAGPLIVALGDEDQGLRAHAALALAGLRDLRAVPVLIALLDDDRNFSKIARALGGFGAEARNAVPALLDVLGREHPRAEIVDHNRPIQVAVALGQIGPEARPAIPALIALIKEHPHTRRATVIALGQIGGPKVRAAVPVFKKLLLSEDHFVRIGAAQTLWRIDGRGDQVLPVLTELLQADGSHRSLAAEVLGEMGDAASDAVPTLRACLEDRSFQSTWIKVQAARALWRIDRSGDWSLPVLIELLRDFANLGAPVATKTAEALGEMGAIARDAIPLLRAASAGDIRPFGGIVDEIVIQDEAFCSAVAESVRRIEADR